jgi:hypothetical protein
MNYLLLSFQLLTPWRNQDKKNIRRQTEKPGQPWPDQDNPRNSRPN